MDVGSVVVAVTGVVGTLGAALLTQRVAERAKRREIDLVRGLDEARQNLALRRACYVALNRESRQFLTAINQHLHIMRERGVQAVDREALDAAKQAHRDQYSEAQMIAPDHVLNEASVVNQALNRVYGQVKRLERAEPEAEENMYTVVEEQQEIWELIRRMRHAMRRDIGVSAE